MELKATAQPLSPVIPAEKSWPAVLADLFKARLSFLVLITTMVGFYVGSAGPVDLGRLLHAMLGTALVAAGGAALNQLLEREHDSKMRRTRERPLPSGRMQPGTVLVIGVTAAVAGLVYLALATNTATFLIGAFTLVTYVLIYTPLKRVTWLNTIVGAVPGAAPPLMGWAAARGTITTEGLALFAIQAFWQLPHFMAIAWIYRDEYSRAGFKMLPVLDPSGHRTARHALGFTLALLAASVCPFVFHLAGPVYLAAALALGAGFLWTAVQFSRELTVARARILFYASILYLPVLFGMMVLDKAG